MMVDVQQLTRHEEQSSNGQELCIGDACEAQETNEIVPKNDGSAENEQGNKFYKEGNYSEAIKMFELAAALGNIDAMVSLGTMHKNGKGVERSFEMARSYYSTAMEAGSSFGEYKLGALYHKWEGPEKDLSTALYHYTQSADEGEKYAAFWLGVMYKDGELVNQDYVKAAHYLAQAAEAGVAVTALTRMYWEGKNGIEKNNKKALYYADIALKKAESSTSEKVIAGIERQLSMPLVVIGIDFEGNANYVEALKLYEKVIAFENADSWGSCSAAWRLGEIYYNGYGIEKNFTQSFHYYEMANNITDCESCLDIVAESKAWLGRMYFIGRGVQKDTTKAFKLLEDAYILEEKKAANTLCAIHHNGYEVEKNSNKAIPYCEKGSEKDSCSTMLGHLYYFTKQYEKALPCLKNAVEEHDNEHAALVLAMMHVNGQAVEQDFDIAREWAEKSGEYQAELLQLINVEIPKTLHGNPDSGSYGIGIDIDIERINFWGFMGLTFDEEQSFFGWSD